jgi:hypothetical protein
MKRAFALVVAALVAAGISSTVHAETIFSQDFEDSIFVVGNTLTTAGVGNSASTAGLWKLGPLSGSNGVGPKVVNDYAHSGSKSMYLTRVSGQAKKLEGFSALQNFTPLNSGVFEVSLWLRQDAAGTTVSLSNHATYSTGSSLTCSSLYAASTGSLSYINASGSWVAIDGVALPNKEWYGLKMVVDLDNSLMDVWYNSGAAWTEVASDVTLKSGYSGNRNVNCMIVHMAAPNDGQAWIDDCTMQTVPEPSGLALLACALAGMAVHVWRKRR